MDGSTSPEVHEVDEVAIICLGRAQEEWWEHKHSSQQKNLRLRSSPHCFNTYTPLFSPCIQILLMIEGKRYLYQLELMKASVDRSNHKRYCHFYQNHDHDIDVCLQLKDKIEALIRRDISRSTLVVGRTEQPND